MLQREGRTWDELVGRPLDAEVATPLDDALETTTTPEDSLETTTTPHDIPDEENPTKPFRMSAEKPSVQTMRVSKDSTAKSS